MTWTFMKFMDLCSRIQIKKRKKKCEFWFSNSFFFKPHAMSAKQCKRLCPLVSTGSEAEWLSESPQVEPLWARHVKDTCVEQPAMCRAFLSLQRTIPGKEGNWLPWENWSLGVPHRLSQLRERECLVVGDFANPWKWGHSRSAHAKKKVGLSWATAGLGSALIEGASETLHCLHAFGSHRTKIQTDF